MYRLWLAGKGDLDAIGRWPIEHVDAANRALDAWEDAHARAAEKNR